MDDDDDHLDEICATIKVIILGNGGVGKSSLAVRYAKNVFVEEYRKTIGVDYLQKTKFIKSVSREIQFNICDTDGLEQFDAIIKKYYRGAQVALFVFSVTDRDSFTAIKSWKNRVVEICGDEIPMFLIMNKIDVASTDRKVTVDEAVNLATKIKMKLFQVSVKGNVDDIFENAALDYFKKGLDHQSTNHIQNIAIANKQVIKYDESINDFGFDKTKSNIGFGITKSNIGFKIGNRSSTAIDLKKKGSGCC